MMTRTARKVEFFSARLKVKLMNYCSHNNYIKEGKTYLKKTIQARLAIEQAQLDAADDD